MLRHHVGHEGVAIGYGADQTPMPSWTYVLRLAPSGPRFWQLSPLETAIFEANKVPQQNWIKHFRVTG